MGKGRAKNQAPNIKNDDTMVEISDGIDELRRVCPDCRNNRAQRPQSNEDAVSKWDGIIRKT